MKLYIFFSNHLLVDQILIATSNITKELQYEKHISIKTWFTYFKGIELSRTHDITALYNELLFHCDNGNYPITPSFDHENELVAFGILIPQKVYQLQQFISNQYPLRYTETTTENTNEIILSQTVIVDNREHRIISISTNQTDISIAKVLQLYNQSFKLAKD
jgi:hypothetical protein